jgi:hypothetical protein
MIPTWFQHDSNMIPTISTSNSKTDDKAGASNSKTDGFLMLSSFWWSGLKVNDFGLRLRPPRKCLLIGIIGVYMAMDQYLLIPFLMGWTSIYQLFWCSPGVQGFDTLPYMCILQPFSWGWIPRDCWFYSGFYVSSKLDHPSLVAMTWDPTAGTSERLSMGKQG